MLRFTVLTWFQFSYHFERSRKIMRLIITGLSPIIVILVTVFGLVIGRCQCDCPFGHTSKVTIKQHRRIPQRAVECQCLRHASLTPCDVCMYVFIFDSFIWLYWTCLGLQVGVKVKQIKTNTVSTEPISIHITSSKCMYVSSCICTYVRKYIRTYVRLYINAPHISICMYVKLSSRLWPVEMISKFGTSAYSLVRTLVAAKMIRIFLLTSSLTFPNNIEKLHQCAA